MQPVEQRGERVLCFDVDPGRRLVEHEQPRPGRQRLRDERSLLLAAREPVQRALRKLRQSDALEGGVDGLTVGALQPADQAERCAPRLDDLAHRRRCVHTHLRALREVADAPAVGERPSRLAEQPHLTARRALEAEREPEQRRLAAAVRAGDRDELAGLDAQRDVVEHARALRVREVDVLELEG